MIITLLVIQHYSADCQDKICIDKIKAVKIALQLDSFNLIKSKEVFYINYIDTCNALTQEQAQIIKDQTFLIDSQSEKTSLLNEKYIDSQSIIKVAEYSLELEKKKSKRLKTKYTVSLVGGGILTIGLTTALLLLLL